MRIPILLHCKFSESCLLRLCRNKFGFDSYSKWGIFGIVVTWHFLAFIQNTFLKCPCRNTCKTTCTPTCNSILWKVIVSKTFPIVRVRKHCFRSKLGSLHLLNSFLSVIFGFWARFLIICSNFVTMKLSIWAKKRAQTQFEQILFWSEPSYYLWFKLSILLNFLEEPKLSSGVKLWIHRILSFNGYFHNLKEACQKGQINWASKIKLEVIRIINILRIQLKTTQTKNLCISFKHVIQ